MLINQAFSLLIVSLAVALLPGLSRLLRIPSPVVEILFGVAMGKSLLNLQFSGDWLQFLAHLGFLLLMFHSGMEIDFNILRKQSWKELSFQFLLFGATLSLSFIAAFYLGRGIFVALILTTTSLGLVMPILKEMEISRTPYGQTLLIAASVADFLTLLGITFFMLGREYGLSWRFIAPLPLFAGFALLLWAGRLWAWWNPEKVAPLLGGQDSQELGVRLSLALLFLFVAMSEMVHLEPVLGAFMGGCVLSFVFRQRADLDLKLSALGFGFLVPIFFINVGMEFNLHNVLSVEQLIFTFKLLILALLVKVIPSLLLQLLNFPAKSALQAGILLSSRLSLIVAAATIGLEEGFIDQEMRDSVILLALFSCLIGPTIFKLSFTRLAGGTS